LPEVTALAHPTRVLTSKAGVAALAGHFRLDTPVEGVATGTTLDLGGARFTFSDTRMLHWPESMVSYLAGDEVLFSQDMFGMHLAGHERFADEVPADVIAHESAKYFANILLPFADAVTRVVGRLPDIAPGVRVVATDHGPVWRRDLDALARQYATWAARPPRPELVVVYDTMWESTAAMARALAEGAYTAGVKVQVMRAGQTHRSDLATALLTAGGLAVGSPVLNGQLFPTIADVLCYVRGLKPRGLVTGVFGSYGWSAAPFEQIQAALDEIKGTAAAPPLLVKFVPQDDDLAHCRALGATMAGRILEACRVVRQPGA
jgi:flavorubredoxin